MANKQVRYNGVIHSFPDDATDDEIRAALEAQDQTAATPPATAPDARTPEGVALDQALNIGKGAVMAIPNTVSALGDIGMKAMSWRPQDAIQPAKDLVKGTVKGALGLVTTPLRGIGALGEAYGLLPPNTVNAPSSEEWAQHAQGAGANALMTGIGAAVSAFPRQGRAAANLNKIGAQANPIPIDTAGAETVLARAQELGTRGSRPPKVLKDFAKYQKSGEPMTYEVGRDFETAAKSLSARESTRINAPMLKQVGDFANAMRTANRAAAEKVGMGDLFDQAMKEYRQAKSIEAGTAIIKKYALRGALYGAGGAAAGGIIYDLYRKQ